jgi:hypothetical protein
MWPNNPRYWLIPFCLAALCGGLLAAEEPGSPGGAGPRLRIVSKTSWPEGIILCVWHEAHPVYETRTRMVNGKAEAYTVVKLVYESVSAEYDFGRDAFYDVAGNKLTREAVEGRVRQGDAVVVSSDGEMLSRAYLRVLKDDTLIIVPEVRAMPKPRPAPAASSTPPLPAPAPAPRRPPLPVPAQPLPPPPRSDPSA